MLQNRLAYLGREGRDRWAPVLKQWNAILVQSLPTLQESNGGGVENPYEVGNPLPAGRKALFKGRWPRPFRWPCASAAA